MTTMCLENKPQDIVGYLSEKKKKKRKKDYLTSEGIKGKSEPFPLNGRIDFTDYNRTDYKIFINF